MRKLLFAIIALPLLASGASAQTVDHRCPATTQQQTVTQDGCQKAIDLFNYMAPQLGGALAGNPAPSARLISLTLSTGAVQGDIPQFNNTTLGTSGARQTTYDVKSTPIPIPSATGALTVYQGFPTPIGRVGHVLALASLTYVPNISTSGVSIQAVSGNYSLSGGTRIDVIQEGDIMPALSFSTLKRSTPRVNLRAEVNQGDTVRVDTLSISTSMRRFEAIKHFGMFGLFAGYGTAHLNSSGIARGTVTVPSSVPLFGGTSQAVGPVSLGQNIDRRDLYSGLSLGGSHLGLQAEAGTQSGGTIATYNQFAHDGSPHPADKSRLYASVGLTLGF